MAKQFPSLPPDHQKRELPHFDFGQNLVLDTSRLRQELGFRDVIDEHEAMKTLAQLRGL